MPDVTAKSQCYPVKERKTGSGVNIAGYPTTDPDQVRSSVKDLPRRYDRGGYKSPAMKQMTKHLSKRKGVM